jgi:hypothetical protein
MVYYAKSLDKYYNSSKDLIKSIKGGKVMAETLATEKGKELALKALQERRDNPPEKIDNSTLYAGSDMYYYCQSCGHLVDILPENWDPRFTQPKRLCDECQALKNLGWLK